MIGEITFSQTFGLVEKGEAPEAFAEIHALGKAMSWVGQLPWAHTYHEIIKPYTGEFLATGKRNGSLRAFAGSLVKARMAHGGDPSDMMTKFEAISKAKPTEFDGSDVLSAASTNVTAGSDTTAISMRAVVYYVLKNPKYHKQLVEEVDKYYSDTGSGVLTYDIANSMSFLQAVIYEAMRLHPVIGQPLPRVVPAGGMDCEGVGKLPAGTVISAAPFVLSRSKEIWGNDAESFRPERWMGSDMGELQRFWFPFGAGARLCVGKTLAWMELTKLLAALFRHFNMRLADKDAEWRTTSYVFLLTSELNVVLEPRDLC
jgi:cytochrome P450